MLSRKLYNVLSGVCTMAVGLSAITMPIHAMGNSGTDISSDGMTSSATSNNDSEDEQISSLGVSSSTDGMEAGQYNSSSYLNSTAMGNEAPVTVLPESVSDATKGIVQVNSIYTNDAGKEFIILGCTGFLIGNTQDGEYVITTNSVVAPTKATRDDAFNTIGVNEEEKDWDKIDLSVKVVVEGDVSIAAEVITRSPELNIAVIKLSQPLYNRTPLSILTSDEPGSDKPYEATQTVYALGFPYAVRYDRNTVMYDQDDVTMSSGSIANSKTYNDIHVIEHDCLITGNNCGGPLINSSGYVIGINQQKKDGRYYCSVDCSELVRIIDALGITYSKVTTSEYEARNSAKDSTNEEETVPDSGNILDQIPLSIIVIVSVVIVIIIALFVILIIILIGQKSNTNSIDSKQNNKDEDKKNKKKEKEEPPRPRPVLAADYHANETVMLQGGLTNETSVLGSGMSGSMYESYGTLIRKSNNENCVIDKQYFSIGKDSLHVNFCIKDNSSISRQHAVIESSGNLVTITDNNSTNGTYVNGQRLSPKKPQTIKNGDVIKLANEEFIYRF
ncbi:MAG: FHA domain-containing protein [Butyrivibrio sp.]|nr:FHA domain-containing protein [Butyrivibrio sp.]MCR4635052.1 FHA domain-containing protein [Butyrivibrio sp.]